MNIELANSMMGFTIRFENGQCPMPENFKDHGVDWDNYIFHCMDEYEFVAEDGRWTEVIFDEFNLMNREIQTLKFIPQETESTLSAGSVKELFEADQVEFKRLEDFTGELNFVAFIPQEDKSYDLTAEFKAVVIYGKLDKVEIVSSKRMDNENRKKLVESVSAEIKLEDKRSSAWWQVPYSIYSGLLRGLCGIITLVWCMPAYILQWVIKKITPKL
jgi:hypothetical protein